MKTQLWLPLCACSILAITACSGGAQVSPAAPADALGAARILAPNAFGEVLSAHKVTVKKQLCIKGSTVVTFSANGTAKGPYPGTFKSTGTWNYTKIPGNNIWTFSQKYVITSGSGSEVDGTITGNGSKIKATCKEFGPATGSAKMRFTLLQNTGSATTSAIHNGSLLEHLN